MLSLIHIFGTFPLNIYPASQPIMYELNKAGVLNDLMTYGVRVKTAFCGPCFGASDAPGNNDFCIRHSTRNFPNREGSNPATGQIASVASVSYTHLDVYKRQVGRI